MISDYFQWRENIKLDEIYLNYHFKEKHRLELIFPHGFHKLTKDGYPIYMQVMGIINLKSSSKLLRLKIYQIMQLRLLKLQLENISKYVLK